MKYFYSHVLSVSGLTLMAASLLTGCVTVDSRSARAEEREDMLILEDKVQKASGNIEGLQMEVQRLQGQLDAIRSGSTQSAQSQSQAMQAALDDFDRRIRLLETAREKDKQEIIDRISAKMADIVKTSAPVRSTKKTSKRAMSDTGYEHEVKSGETLSDIAAAYGVKPSVIVEANDLKNPNQLKVGQKLFIPE